MRELMVTTFLTLNVLVDGCAVPNSYKERMGWETKGQTREEQKQKGTPYERSLREEYVDSDTKDLWRVLNYMMYFLAKGKQNAARDRGTGDGELTGWVEQLQNLNAARDSTEVLSIYRKIFAGDDTEINNPNGNSFIDVVLKNRLDQVMRWGFDPQGRLTEFGKLLTQHGPLEDIMVGEATIEGDIRIGSTKYYVMAVEDPHDLLYVVKKVILGGSVAKVDQPTDDFGDAGAQKPKIDEESEVNKMKLLATYSVPVDTKTLDMRDMTITRLPGPDGGVSLSIDQSYFLMHWSHERLVLDISGNIEDFQVTDSIGKKIIQLALEYKIYRKSEGDSSVLVTEETKPYNIDVTGARSTDGFTLRPFTIPLAKDNTYVVKIRLTNGEKTFISGGEVDMGKKTYSLRVVESKLPTTEKDQASFTNSIPPFHVGPVSKKFSVFFAVDGLQQSNDGYYHGVAYVLLTDPKVRESSVIVGKIFQVEWDSLPRPDPDMPYSNPNYPPEIVIGKVFLKSPFERGFFTCEIALPSSQPGGTTKELSVDIYTTDLTGKAGKSLGFASTRIQID